MDEPAWVGEALYLRGFAAAQRGDQERAEISFSECLAMSRELGSVRSIAAALEALGTVAREQGDVRRAAARFAESLVLLQGGEDPLMIANCIRSLGAVAAAVGQAERAARLLGAAEALRARRGLAEQPHERAYYDRLLAPARAGLAAADFAAAWAAGRALPLEQAVAEALAVADDVARSAPRVAGDASGLTPREGQILKLLTEGRTDQEIADALFISRRTANTHVASILAKLGARSRREAAALATERHLI
jgi:non-specific serine/threonine protein kinase